MQSPLAHESATLPARYEHKTQELQTTDGCLEKDLMGHHNASIQHGLENRKYILQLVHMKKISFEKQGVTSFAS
jgi:hypothetical protein